jgi:hypothetical protein
LFPNRALTFHETLVVHFIEVELWRTCEAKRKQLTPLPVCLSKTLDGQEDSVRLKTVCLFKMIDSGHELFLLLFPYFHDGVCLIFLPSQPSDLDSTGESLGCLSVRTYRYPKTGVPLTTV